MLHNKLPDIIRSVRQRGSPGSIRVVTNGTVLSYARIKDLCDAGITSIAFSIDSMNPERFAKSRGGAKLQKVIDNLEALVAYKNEQQLHNLEIKIKAVLIDEPYNEADALMKVSARLGIEMPHFSCLDSRGNAKENYHESWMKDEWSATESPEFLLWAQNRWQELNSAKQNVLSQHPSPHREDDFIHPVLQPENLCRWAIDAVFISSSGDLLSCCEQMIDMPRQYRGSLMKKNLSELWQDDLLWNYRLPLSAGVAPQACVGCNWAPAEAM
jgi:molybdenum cofactor biosynthesis enzyme MoaA